MSMEQVRAQREYLDANDLAREAEQKIAELTDELARWRRIKSEAGALGAIAFAAITDEPAPQTDM